jgi:hypothetical protein
MTMLRFDRRVLVLLALALVAPRLARAQQPLETETARLPARGTFLSSLAYEFQTSPQGTEHALPPAFEYGITDRLALLVEPVLFTSVRPNSGRSATGFGDLEATLQLLAHDETRLLPAFAVAAEVKFPTARDTLIGTRRTDFTPYLIASKRFGHFDTHVNAGYSFVGKPQGIPVSNTLNFAVAMEDHINDRFDVMGEVLTTTASGAAEGVTGAAPEIAGAEQVGMLGVRWAARPRTWLSLGVTYDNTNALLLRPGITIESPF